MATSNLSPLTPAPRADWRDQVVHHLVQEPLLDTAESLGSLENAPLDRPPAAIFVGIGLCSPTRLGRALPLDVLGMLIPAELIRRSCDAREVLVMIADRHAAASGFDDDAVDRRADAIHRALATLASHPGLRLRVVRASSFHDLAAYRRLRADVEDRLDDPDPYVARQLADTAFFNREYGRIWKIGWTLGANTTGRRDETRFDSLFRACYGDRLGFVYCKPGRSLADHRPKASPYLAPAPAERVCLDPDEVPEDKLSEQAPCSSDTLNGVRRHLKRILYSYRRHLGPLPRGDLETRLRWLIDDLLAD